MSARIVLAVAFALPHLLAASALAAPPTDAEIQQAVRELGDKRFTVREKASKLLWQAGRAAEAALRDAARGDDPESARRARTILEKFDWGIFPDTPKPIADLVDQYRTGDRTVRHDIVGKLMQQGRPGLETLKRLARRETNDAERKAIFQQMTTHARHAVPGLLLGGDLALAEELLELCLNGEAETDVAAANYATFLALRGTLNAALSRWEKEWTASHAARTGEVLVHLFRAKGDFRAARGLAEQMKNEALVEQLLWEEGNWKELTARMRREGVGPRESLTLGMKAAFQRLAGERDEFEKTIGEIKKLADSNDRFELRSAAEALLLNGKTAEALEILLSRKKNVAMAFDLLCAQMKHQEAFELARSVKLLEGDEAFAVELRRGRMLYLLGEKDEAVQIFNKLAEGLKEPGQATSVRDLVKVLVRISQKERAANLCGTFLANVQKQGATSGWGQVLEPLFEEQAEAAEIWWQFLRKKQPDQDPGVAMQKVLLLFQGKAVEGRDAWAEELAAAAALTAEHARAVQAAAAAEVMRRARQLPKAQEYYALALKREPTFAVALRLGDLAYAENRYQEAATHYARAAQADPSQALASYLQGMALGKAGDEKESRRLLDLAHWIPLGDERARGQFAEELEKRGFGDEARRQRDFVLNHGWYRAWHVGNILNQASRAALQRKDYDRAVALIEKGIVGCLRMGASFVDTTAYLVVPQSIPQCRARAALARGNVDAAVTETQASLGVLPGNLELVIAVVPALQKAGRDKAADDLFRQTLGQYEKLSRDHPNSAYAHNSCAWLAANCRRELDAALKHAQTAVSLEPKSAGYLDTLAEVHFRRQEKDQALAAMKKCLALEPNNQYFRRQLARFTKGDFNAEVPDGDDD